MAANDSITRVTVYGLSSSRDGAIRYVGQTIQLLKNRMNYHRFRSRKNPRTAVARWMAREHSDGFSVTATVLIENAVWHESEIKLIAEYRENGYRLLNLTDGGEGTLGWHGNLGNKRPDLAERNRSMLGKPGKKNSPECRAKISAALKGREAPWVSERNKTDPPWLGRKHSEETREKQSLALKGRVITWGHKISEALKRKNAEKKRALPQV